MHIWLINHYAVPPEYYPLARTSTFAKYLMSKGHTVTVFAASTVHNSDINLITGREAYREEVNDGIHYVYIRARGYQGNGKSRVINMLGFARRLPSVCRHFEKPDVIMASSATPQACMAGLKLAKRLGCRGVAEISDLWPESFVAYDLIGRRSLLLKLLYRYERRIYERADAIVFTMEGGRDYILGKGWDKEHGGTVDIRKVHYINNGVDLQAFEQNRERYTHPDEDMDDPDTFKVVYAGSIKLANQVQELVGVAEALRNAGAERVRILIWGDGDQAPAIRDMIAQKGLTNIKLKGRVPKTHIPSILSRGDLNIFILPGSPLYRYGISLNKLFDYLASGKPVISSSRPGYSIIDSYQCGSCLTEFTPERAAAEIIRFADMPKHEYDTYCRNAYAAARDYDFDVLTERLLRVLDTKRPTST